MPHWILEPKRCDLCGKLSYANREDAEYAARKMLLPMASYECLYGNGWHLTTVRKRGREVDASGPENRRTERLREFESHRFLHIVSVAQRIEPRSSTPTVAGSSGL